MSTITASHSALPFPRPTPLRKKKAPPTIKPAPIAKANMAQSQNLPAPPPSPSKARAQKKLRHHGSSSISSITGKTAIKAAQEAAARHSRRSHSPPAFRSGLEGVPRPQPVTSSESAPSSSDPNVTIYRLPVYLPRPTQPTPIDPTFIKTTDPNWDSEKLPLEGLIRYLGSPRTIAGLTRGLHAIEYGQTPPGPDLPPSISLSVKSDIAFDNTALPTHMMVVVDSKTQKGTVYPVHALLMATQCARLPKFPPPAPRRPDSENKVAIPFYSLTVSHGPSFGVLYAYFYSRSAERLLDGILGLGADPRLKREENKDFDSMARQIIDVIVEKYSSGAILDKLRWVHGMWSNVVDLAINDQTLWHWMDISWQLLMKALIISRKQEGNPIPNAK